MRQHFLKHKINKPQRKINNQKGFEEWLLDGKVHDKRTTCHEKESFKPYKKGMILYCKYGRFHPVKYKENTVKKNDNDNKKVSLLHCLYFFW